MTSVRVALTVGVAVFVIMVGGLVGGFSIWGEVQSAIELTRSTQNKQTAVLFDKVSSFVENLEHDLDVMADVLSQGQKNLTNQAVIDTLTPFAINKEHLKSITLVRKNQTNVWVGEWK